MVPKSRRPLKSHGLGSLDVADVSPFTLTTALQKPGCALQLGWMFLDSPGLKRHRPSGRRQNEALQQTKPGSTTHGPVFAAERRCWTDDNGRHR